MSRKPLLALHTGNTVTDALAEANAGYAKWATIPMAVVTSVLLIVVMALAAVAVQQLMALDTHVTALNPSIVTVRINGTATCASTPHVAGEPRRARAYRVRLASAYAHFTDEPVCHASNGDVAAYAAYTKGLPHDSLGHVLPTPYAALLRACHTGVPADFDAIPLATGYSRGLVNPLSGLAYSLQGGDPFAFTIPAAPAFASAEQAGEAVECYWMAYTRDVPFAQYGSHSRTLAAVAEIGELSDFRGPPVSSSTLFRGTSPGCDVGPYLSQFFYQPCSFGANHIEQRFLPPTSNVDFMTDFTSYLQQQQAQEPLASLTYGTTPLYMSTMRHLTHWVHKDVLFQAYFMAMLCLLNTGVPIKPGIPYALVPANQVGFATFGGPDIAALSTIGATNALRGVWAQKWFVHRRLRPEAFGARVHNYKTGAYTSYPLHQDILNATILGLIYAQQSTYLLPQAFPEGSPMHPSYASGHATVAGMCVTLLKAIFVETTVMSSPLMPNPGDGGETVVALSPSADLTVGHELNKLAWNVALGRNGAGVHWRSDATEGLALGERMAIRLLRDLRTTYVEPFAGFSFTDFDGNVVNV